MKWIIPLSSNVISAIYVVLFDLLLTALLAIIVRRFLSSWNIKSIYEDRDIIYLQQNKFAVLVPQQLSTRSAGFFTTIASTTIVLLTLAGSFSLNGTSRPQVTSRVVPFLVQGTFSNNTVDYSKHVSEDGRLVSGSFLLARSALHCKALRERTSHIFAAFNTVQDLYQVKWDIATLFVNSTCVMLQNNYVNRVAISEVYQPTTPSGIGCHLTLATYEFSEVAQVQANIGDDCPYKMEETWCASFNGRFCVSLVSFNNLYTTLTIEEPGDNSTSGRRIRGFDPSFLKTRPNSLVLRSMTYLISTGATRHPPQAREVSMLAVYENATIEFRSTDERTRETEVILELLLGTTGTAIVLTMILGIISCACWHKYVTKEGRTAYNKFHSVTDMLSCALCEVHNNGTCRFRQEDTALLWVSNGVPQLQSATVGKVLTESSRGEYGAHFLPSKWDADGV